MLDKSKILDATELKKDTTERRISGLILIKDYTKKPTKNGSFFLDGLAELKGQMPIRVWSNTDAFNKMTGSDYRNTVVSIEGKTNYFNGLSIILEQVYAVDLKSTEISKSDFFYTKYNIDGVFKALDGTVRKSVDTDTYKIFKILINDRILDRFKNEFAAKMMHDNCKGGLVAHTCKVIYAVSLLKRYPNIMAFEGSLDLVILGAAIHDMGKVYEYTDGTIQGLGRLVSHHTFGIEMLFAHKEEIISLKGEEFFYRLCAIVEQHHGEYEEEPRTVEAYVIHLIDKLESDLQMLDQTMENFNRGDQISINNFKLS